LGAGALNTGRSASERTSRPPYSSFAMPAFSLEVSRHNSSESSAACLDHCWA
jgi:hypothetical protein